MAQQYLVDIGMNDSLVDVVRKCNHNFRTMSASQRRQSRVELRTGLDDLDEAINQELTQISNQLGEEASTRFNEDTRLQGEIDEIIAEGGTSDYNKLRNKPKIESVTLQGDKSFPELGIFIDPDEEYPRSDDYAIENTEITAMWNLIMNS